MQEAALDNAEKGQRYKAWCLQLSFEEKSRVNFNQSCGCSAPTMGLRDQKGVTKRKGEVERVSWRRWALSQALENERTRSERKLEPCQASCRPRGERAAFLRRLALQGQLHFSTPLIQEFCENEAVVTQRRAIGISIQSDAIIQCSYIQDKEHLLSIISVQSFGENMIQPLT